MDKRAPQLVKRLRSAFWLVVLAVALGGAFGLNYWYAHESLVQAREKHAWAQDELERATLRKEGLQRQASALRSQTDALILDARREYRLVFPDERIELIHVREASFQDTF